LALLFLTTSQVREAWYELFKEGSRRSNVT